MGSSTVKLVKIILKTQPFKPCGNGPKRKQQMKKIRLGKISKKGKRLCCLNQSDSLLPHSQLSKADTPLLTTAAKRHQDPPLNSRSKGFYPGRSLTSESFLLLQLSSGSWANGWEEKAPFTCPDPTHEMEPHSQAWCAEDPGVSMAVALAQV